MAFGDGFAFFNAFRGVGIADVAHSIFDHKYLFYYPHIVVIYEEAPLAAAGAAVGDDLSAVPAGEKTDGIGIGSGSAGPASSSQPKPQLRTKFPETWIWAEVEPRS